MYTFMKKHPKLLIVVSVVVIVVVGTGASIGIYRLLSSPPAHAWMHDWLGTPNGLTAVATLLAAIGTFVAVTIALFGLRGERIRAAEDRKEARQQFEQEQERARNALEDERRRFQEAQAESQRQFLEAQEQAREDQEESRRQFLEAQYAADRPILVPLPRMRIPLDGGEPERIYWDDTRLPIEIRNVGPGIATNVWGVFMPPQPLPLSSHQYSLRLVAPLSSGDTVGRWEQFSRGGTMFNCDDKVSGYSLCVPRELAPEENFNQLDRRDRRIARLTLTYHDIFGRKHASIFDYTQIGIWIEVAIIPNIEHDLGEMDEAKGHELMAAQRVVHFDS